MEVLVGYLIQIAAIAVAAFVVVWQVGEQFKSAIEANKKNEAQKLKLDLYKDINKKFQSALTPTSRLMNFPASVDLAFLVYEQSIASGYKATIPAVRALELRRLNDELTDHVIDIIHLVEAWHVIDPRIEIFRTALNAAKYDFDQAFNPYFQASLTILPIDMEPEHGEGVYPWSLPDNEKRKVFKALGDNVSGAAQTIQAYINDFRDEMQNLLLGELFEGSVEPRKPIDPRHKVITLDKHEELNRYFTNETAWGINAAEIEEKVRSSLKKQEGQGPRVC